MQKSTLYHKFLMQHLKDPNEAILYLREAFGVEMHSRFHEAIKTAAKANNIHEKDAFRAILKLGRWLEPYLKEEEKEN